MAQRPDHRRLTDKLIVRTADRGGDDLTADGEAQSEEDHGPGEASGDGPEIDRAMERQAEGDCDDHPADRVVDDGGRDDHLTEIAAEEAHLPDHHCDDLD